jgi:hypothetical protein
MSARDWVRHTLCRWLGHRWRTVAAPPVLGQFSLCWRCGKWER